MRYVDCLPFDVSLSRARLLVMFFATGARNGRETASELRILQAPTWLLTSRGALHPFST